MKTKKSEDESLQPFSRQKLPKHSLRSVSVTSGCSLCKSSACLGTPGGAKAEQSWV